MTDTNHNESHHHINIENLNLNSVEPSNNHIHSHECDHNDKNEDNGIITFRLGDENHSFEEDDEVIHISFKSTLKLIFVRRKTSFGPT